MLGIPVGVFHCGSFLSSISKCYQLVVIMCIGSVPRPRWVHQRSVAGFFFGYAWPMTQDISSNHRIPAMIKATQSDHTLHPHRAVISLHNTIQCPGGIEPNVQWFILLLYQFLVVSLVVLPWYRVYGQHSHLCDYGTCTRHGSLVLTADHMSCHMTWA